MDSPLIIRGTFSNKTFVPTDPLPEAEGPAELIVHVQEPLADEGDDTSLFDLFGKAPQLRSAEDIDAQLQAERDSWDDS
jgi:hypothetical protein